MTNYIKHCFLFFFSFLLISNCSLFKSKTENKQVKSLQCAPILISISFNFYKQGKDFFASYYKTRSESELFYAWYSTEDSKYMASKVKQCVDKKNKHFYAVKNLLTKNKYLQSLILQNMRPSEQTIVSEIFLEEYRKLFPRDIR